MSNIFKIPQIEPNFDHKESKALSEYMNSGGWITEFKKTIEFEDAIKKFTNAKYCFAVNNGTISLTIAAIACGIKPGDEVIVPNYTMIATPNSIKMIGANPILVDVEENTLCLDFNLLKKKINKKTKAIILVNPNGRYPEANINKIKKYCKTKKLFLIEDAAQGLGSFYPNGTHMGLNGDVGSISFSSPKIISTGQGGALITNNFKLADKIKKLKDFGRIKSGNDIHDTIGFNSKFTDIQAVVGIEQMKKLKNRIKNKKRLFLTYKKCLEKNKNVKIFNCDINFTTPWFIDIIANERNKLAKYLLENGIGTRYMYPPINEQKAYRINGDFKISKNVGNKGLWLPSSPWLKNNQIKFICEKIKNFYDSQ